MVQPSAFNIIIFIARRLAIYEEKGLKKKTKLSYLTKEEEVYMNLIWSHPEGILSSEIYSYFNKPRGTTAAILHNIVKKGFLITKPSGRENIYIPLISKLKYHQKKMLDMMECYFGVSSFAGFIASFCGRGSLTNEQYNRLSEFLQELEEEK